MSQRNDPSIKHRSDTAVFDDSESNRLDSDVQNGEAKGWWLRIGVLLLIVAGLGLPINDLPRYSILLIAAIIAFTGRATRRPRLWLGACLVVIAAIGGRALFPPPLIEEGHNIFIVDTPGGALERGLPREVFRLMSAEFDEVYPPAQRCRREQGGCWRAHGFPDRTFALSADGLWDRPAYSRRVAGINFNDPAQLRFGFPNELRYDWNTLESDIRRLQRSRAFWMGWHRWNLQMPWFVMYELPSAFAGGTLCWRGQVIWEERDGRFDLVRHTSFECRAITQDDVGKRIFGLAIRPGSLAMKLHAPFWTSLWQIAVSGLAVIAAVGVIILLVRSDRRAIALPFLLITLSLMVIAIDDASLIGGFRPLDSGEDAIVYENYARQIAEHLRLGNFMAALEGGEKVFFFGGSALRYPRAIERLLFGDTNLGYLSLILTFPLLMFAMYRRLLSVRWALALSVVFVAVPVGHLFGTSFYQFAVWVARGYADPAGAMAAVAGLLVLFGRNARSPTESLRSAFFASLLFAVSVLLRPNGSIFAATVLTGAGLAMLYRGQWARFVCLCVGFVPVGLLALHNWYFGGVFVPFSSVASHPLHLLMPPWAWLGAVVDLLQLNWGGRDLGRAISQLTTWLSGPGESAALIPLHLAAVVILITVVARASYDPWVRLVALAALMQHLVSLTFAITPRYHLAAWLFTSLVVLVWVRETGVAWFERTFPRGSDWIRRHEKVTDLVDRLQRLTGQHEPRQVAAR